MTTNHHTAIATGAAANAAVINSPLSELDAVIIVKDGTVAFTGAQSLGGNNLTNVGALSMSSMGTNWTNAGRTIADLGIVTTADINGGTLDGVTIGAGAQAAAFLAATDILGASNTKQLTVKGYSTQTVAIFEVIKSDDSNLLSINNNALITIAEGGAFVLGTSSGTKIGTATNQKIGFWNKTPIVQPSAYTQTYSTADKTIGAYTPDDESGAYTGIDNAQGATPYAQVSEMNELRVAYENLRAFVEDGIQALNSVIDDLQATGLAA